MTKWIQDIPNLTMSTLLLAFERGIKYLPYSRYLEMTLQLYHRASITPIRGYRIGILSTDSCFRCGTSEGTLYHFVWERPMIQTFWKRVNQFARTHLVNHVPHNPIWAIFGYIDPDDISCTPGSRKLLLYMISAAGMKPILHTWNNASPPPFKLFLEKLSYLMKMDWAKVSLRKEALVQGSFENWVRFITLLSAHAQRSFHECFALTTWYLERVLTNDLPINL